MNTEQQNIMIAAMSWSLTQLVVKQFVWDTRWYPVAALLFAVGFTVLLGWAELTPWTLVQGVLNGLAAVGGNSGTKTFVQRFQDSAPGSGLPNRSA